MLPSPNCLQGCAGTRQVWCSSSIGGEQLSLLDPVVPEPKGLNSSILARRSRFLPADKTASCFHYHTKGPAALRLAVPVVKLLAFHINNLLKYRVD